MYNIQNLNVGDTFHYVYSFWWNMELKIIRLLPEKGVVQAICTESQETDYYDFSDMNDYYKDKDEAYRAYKEAKSNRLDELSDIPHLLDCLFKEQRDITSPDAELYKTAVELAKRELSEYIIGKGIEEDPLISPVLSDPLIKPGDRVGNLKAIWCWKAKYDYIWKCSCRCGKYCYVKERALLERIVTDCGCGTFK